VSSQPRALLSIDDISSASNAQFAADYAYCTMTAKVRTLGQAH